MRILISILRFEPGKALGSEVYLRSMLEGLAAVRRGEQVTIAATETAAAWGRRFAPDLEWVSRKTSGSIVRRAVSETGVADKLAREHEADVIFFPLNVMPRVSVPSVLLIHDLVNEFYSRKFPLYRPIYYRTVRSLVRRSIRQADSILTISRTVAAELEASKLLRAGQKVFVAPLSSPPVGAKKRPAELSEINKRIVLQTGDHLPHKNQITGLKAMAVLRSKHPRWFDDVQMVLTGGSTSNKELRDFVKSNGLAGDVTFLGKVKPAELEWLMQEAELICFPTLYEGFGLGVIEGQLRRKQLLVSDIPVLREVSRDSAIFFDPKDPDELAEKMALVLERDSYDRSLIDRGAKNAASWTWQDHASRVLEVLKLTANIGKAPVLTSSAEL